MSHPRPAAGRDPRGRSTAARLAIAGVLALPLLEIVVAILVGRAIGAAPTVLLLILLSLLGLFVLREAGGRALRSLSRQAADGVRTGTPDLRAAGDAGWVVLGGLLLTVPGFVSAVCGLLLVLTPTRRLLAPVLGRGAGRLASRVLGVPLVGRVVGTRVVAGDVVDATVVDVEVVPPLQPSAPELSDRPVDPPAAGGRPGPGPDGGPEADPDRR